MPDKIVCEVKYLLLVQECHVDTFVLFSVLLQQERSSMDGVSCSTALDEATLVRRNGDDLAETGVQDLLFPPSWCRFFPLGKKEGLFTSLMLFLSTTPVIDYLHAEFYFLCKSSSTIVNTSNCKSHECSLQRCFYRNIK